ncbi:hypothetical protein ACFVAD_20175, partial [Sutcliffiella sp. NPDC057660]|uniref:hypothetical protein n=1 Tax=Sutcliffiella sp. NPDC057660 TaxID=3346199 RepID=UPI0036CF6252
KSSDEKSEEHFFSRSVKRKRAKSVKFNLTSTPPPIQLLKRSKNCKMYNRISLIMAFPSSDTNTTRKVQESFPIHNIIIILSVERIST